MDADKDTESRNRIMEQRVGRAHLAHRLHMQSHWVAQVMGLSTPESRCGLCGDHGIIEECRATLQQASVAPVWMSDFHAVLK
ncbi:MAG: hypothetical protein WCI03_05070 [bacterium]|jgi:hypothetical protein